MKLHPVPAELAAQGWAKAAEFIHAACDRTELFDARIIRSDVLSGKSLLWIAADGVNVIGAGVTHIFEQAEQKVLEILAWGARDQARCAPLLRDIEKHAAAQGCDVVRVVGRKGWARHMRDYSAKAVILEKAI